MICGHCNGSGYFAECIDDLCHGGEECIHGDDATCRVCGGEGEVEPFEDEDSDYEGAEVESLRSRLAQAQEEYLSALTSAQNEAEFQTERAEAAERRVAEAEARAERLREGLTRLIEACHRLSQSSDEFWQEVRAAEGLAEAQEVEARAEAAQDVGAHLMLDQMEKAVAGGGRFSDERANRFVAAEARAERLRELLVGAMYFIQHSAPDAPLLVEIRAALAPEPQPARSRDAEPEGADRQAESYRKDWLAAIAERDAAEARRAQHCSRPRRPHSRRAKTTSATGTGAALTAAETSLARAERPSSLSPRTRRAACAGPSTKGSAIANGERCR